MMLRYLPLSLLLALLHLFSVTAMLRAAETETSIVLQGPYLNARHHWQGEVVTAKNVTSLAAVRFNLSGRTIRSTSKERFIIRADHAAPNHDFSARPRRFDTSMPIEPDGFVFVLPKAYDWSQLTHSPRNLAFVRSFSRTHTYVVQVHWRPVWVRRILEMTYGEEGADNPQNRLMLVDGFLQHWINMMRQQFDRAPRYSNLEVKTTDILKDRIEKNGEYCREYVVTAMDTIPGLWDRPAPYNYNGLVCIWPPGDLIVDLSISERRLEDEESYRHFVRDKKALFSSLKFKRGKQQ